MKQNTNQTHPQTRPQAPHLRKTPESAEILASTSKGAELTSEESTRYKKRASSQTLKHKEASMNSASKDFTPEENLQTRVSSCRTEGNPERLERRYRAISTHLLPLAKIVFFISTPLIAGLLYWSSLLIESKNISVEQQLQEINHRIDYLALQLHAERSDGAAKPSSIDPYLNRARDVDSSGKAEGAGDAQASDEKAESTQYEGVNLLTEDPFYQKTLKKLLDTQPERLGQKHFTGRYTLSGTQQRGFFLRPEDIHPLSNDSSIMTLWDLTTRWMGRCHVGFYDRLAPSLAKAIVARPRIHQEETSQESCLREGEFWVYMRDDIYWQPLNPRTLPKHLKIDTHFFKPHKVTAWDVKFYLDAIANPHLQIPGAIAQRELYSDVEAFEVIDDYTFVVRWKLHKRDDGKLAMKYSALNLVAGLRPLPRFVYQYYPDGTKIITEDQDPHIYRTHSVWAQIFLEHWAQHTLISCGDWTLETFTSNEMLFKKNAFAPDPYGALNAKLHITLKDSPESLWHDFKNNRLDWLVLSSSQRLDKELFMESPTYAEQAQRGNTINEISYPSGAYFYVGWNCSHPLFRDKLLRRAMTIAIHRDQIIRQHLQGEAEVITGPFNPHSPSYNRDREPLPYDPFLAGELLREAGWEAAEDGVLRNSEGIPLRFTLNYPTKVSLSKRVAESIADDLRKIGVACTPHGLDINDFSQALESKTFDAYIGGWQIGMPPENIRQLWHSSSARAQGSSNYVGFAHEEADKIIEAIDYVYDPQEREELYHRFHTIIYEEQPYTFLFTPKRTLVFRERLKNIFLPKERQDLIPGATVVTPNPRLYYVEERENSEPSARQAP